MKAEELNGLSDEALNVRLAELIGHDEWVIIKQGAYYRPNGCGYTESIKEAWRLPHSEAKKHEMYADNDQVPNCEKVLIARAPLPQFCTDLNAVAEVERTLTNPQYERFMQDLWVLVNPEQTQRSAAPIRCERAYLTAPARQRTIALILTLTA